MTAIARIEGYASIFNVRDMNGDIVAPGAFSRSLRRRGPGRVRMLYQHAVEAPLGRWTRLKEDAKGLYAVGELILETERSRDIAALIEGCALDGLSIGFQTVKARKEQSARVILEADLWEISVVTFPMAEGARIAALTYPEPAALAGDFAETLKSAAEIFETRSPSIGRHPARNAARSAALQMRDPGAACSERSAPGSRVCAAAPGRRSAHGMTAPIVHHQSTTPHQPTE